MPKKVIFSFLVFFTLSLFPENDIDKIIVQQSSENLSSILGSANPVYIYFTFNNTTIWDKPVEQYLKERKNRGKNAEEDKEKMMKDFKNTFDSWIKNPGSKWGMIRIDDLSEAKKGYILKINYDKLVSAPMAGATGHATLEMYPVVNPKDTVFIGKMKALVVAWTWANITPVDQFGKMGRAYAPVIVDFFRKNGK